MNKFWTYRIPDPVLETNQVVYPFDPCFLKIVRLPVPSSYRTTWLLPVLWLLWSPEPTQRCTRLLISQNYIPLWSSSLSHRIRRSELQMLILFSFHTLTHSITSRTPTHTHYRYLSTCLWTSETYDKPFQYKFPGKYDIRLKYSGGQKRERKMVVFSDPEEEARIARLQAEARARSGVPEKSILKPPPGTPTTSLQYNPMSLGNLLGCCSSFSVALSVSL